MAKKVTYESAALKLLRASHETPYRLMKETMLYNGLQKMRVVAP